MTATPLHAILDRFLHPCLRAAPSERLEPLRLLVLLTLAAAVGGVVLLARMFAAGDTRSVAPRVAMLAVVLLVLALTRTNRPRAAALHFLGAAYATILVVVWLSGGATSRATYLFVLLPFLAAGLDARRGVFATVTAAAGATIAALYAAHALGFVIPPRIVHHTLEVDVLFLAVATSLVYLVASRFVGVRARARAVLTGAVARVTRANVDRAAASDRATRAAAARESLLVESGAALLAPLDAVRAAARRVRALAPRSADDAVAMLTRSADQLVARVSAFLAHAEAGCPAAVTLRRCDPEAVVASVVASAIPTAASRGVTLWLEVGADVAGERLGDPARLGGVVGALLDNAIKFTPAGGQVAVRLGAAGADRIAVAVEDTGIGVAPEVAPRIFDPFVRGEAPLHARFEGLGLGLAIAKRLTAALGGTLALTRTSPAGSCFTLTLSMPLAPGHAEVGA